jgi:hypothetical protein
MMVGHSFVDAANGAFTAKQELVRGKNLRLHFWPYLGSALLQQGPSSTEDEKNSPSIVPTNADCTKTGSWPESARLAGNATDDDDQFSNAITTGSHRTNDEELFTDQNRQDLLFDCSFTKSNCYCFTQIH